MTRKTHSLRYTGSAIAAALAFLSTSSLAQDAAMPAPVAQAPAEPAIVIPNIPVAPPSAPTIVVPPVQAETVQPLPAPSVAEPEPQASPSVAAPAAQTRVAPPAARAARQQPAAAASPIESSGPAEPETVAALPPVTEAEPLAVEPAPPVAVDGAPRPSASDDSGLLALTLGGLAFLGLAIWGFVAIGRRKSVRRYAAETPPHRAAVTPVPIVTEPAPAIVREPLAVAPREPAFTAPSFATRQVSGASGALPHTGASVALPARAPESFAERDALMKRMIAAKPDRANPFTDRGARTRRARLILQSLGRDFGSAEPWIDLSQYPNNWPELARKRSAAA